MTDTEDEDKFAKTRKMSIVEGNFGVLSAVIQDNYTVPFAIAVGSTPIQVGLLSSSGGFLSPLGQIIGSRLMEKISRQKVLYVGIIGITLLIPLYILISIMFDRNAINSETTWYILIIFLGYVIFAGLMVPPWFSVMGDVIGENGRGNYFAKRNLYNNIIALSGTMLIALILDWYKARDQVFIGFAVVFLIGFITRVFSVIFFTQHYYPPFKFEASDHVSLHKFIAELPKSNFGKFTTFVALLVFGQWIAGPFFSVYMLNELNFSYTDLIMVNLSTSVFGLFFFTIFGKIGDKYGNVFLMRIGAIIIPLLPLMWLFLDTPWGLILGPQLLGGIGWTAFNLATSNFIYDNIPSKKRGEYVAFYNFFLGIGVITGGLIGSILVEFMPITFINNILFVFLLSGIVRGIVVIIYLPQIREIRNISVKPIFNLKGNLIYKWLNDLLLREHGKTRKNNRNNH